MLGVAAAVQVREDLERLLLAAVAWSVVEHTGKAGENAPVAVHEPARRLGEEEHADGEDDGGDHLDAPGDTERGVAVDVRAAKLDKVLEKDTPGDRPGSGLGEGRNMGANMRRTIAAWRRDDHGWREG